MNYAKFNKGISIIEILVAMALGTVLLSAVIQVLVANNAASRTISGFSSLQENARIGLNDLSESLRFAGHFGGVEWDDVSVVGSIALTGVGDCDHDWIVDTAFPIQGFEGASSVGDVQGLPQNCIPEAQYVTDSDIVVVRYGSSFAATPIADLENDKVYMRTAISSQDIDGAEIFLGSDFASTQVGGNTDGVGVYNYEYKTELYFLSPCSTLNEGVCDDEIPTLFRYSLDGSEFTIEPVAEGVEQFQLEYGVDSQDEFGDTSKSDNVADAYQIATQITDWHEVVSARFSIVIRTETSDSSVNDTDNYSLVGDFEYQASEEVSSYQRKVFTKVIQLRNMSRG